MRKIILDCERMKFPHTGLYHYCMNLGRYLEKNICLSEEQLFFYTPPREKSWSFSSTNHLPQNSLHKFIMPPLGEYEIWHATYQNTNYMPFRNKKIKVVLSIHDLNFLYDEKKTEAKKQKYLRHLQSLIDRSNVIVCISEFSKKDVLEHCDVKGKPLHVIYNGTNMLARPRLNVNSYKPKRPFLFSIGVINRKKNFHVLLPLLQYNPIELLIAGKPDDHDYLTFINRQSRKLGVERNLRMLGSVTETEKSWYFNNCSAFALPSVSEGFGLPVAEAMSCGKPLFLSDRTVLPEIGGNVSFYFRDFHPDHIRQVFQRGMEEYKDLKLGKRIKERGKNFNWHLSALKYLDVYRSLY